MPDLGVIAELVGLLLAEALDAFFIGLVNPAPDQRHVRPGADDVVAESCQWM
jgi:hypothetical protein